MTTFDSTRASLNDLLRQPKGGKTLMLEAEGIAA